MFFQVLQIIYFSVPVRIELDLRFAPPCSSWVLISANSTGRTTWNPLGFTQYPRVAWNNDLVHKVSILLELCTALDIYFIVEQPASSRMWSHPRLIGQHTTGDIHISPALFLPSACPSPKRCATWFWGAKCDQTRPLQVWSDVAELFSWLMRANMSIGSRPGSSCAICIGSRKLLTDLDLHFGRV